MIRHLGFCLAMLMAFSLFLPMRGGAEDSYRFDDSEIEKKPYHFGGYVEFKPVLYGLDHDTAFYKLRFYDTPQGQTLP
jgi:hypothetical protein